MKLRVFTLSCLLAATAFAADERFPGIKAVMSDAEWHRAGLDRLTPDQIGVIDAALIGHYRRALMSAGALPAMTNTGSPIVASKSIWERFGLVKGLDWRDQTPLVAKVLGWKSPNRFLLDNGQEWESTEPIRFEIVDKEVTISARPSDTYALSIEAGTNGPRVRRVK
jgi:hypothetical protein